MDKDGNLYKIILETLLKNIDEGVHVIDKNGNTLIYNKAMEKLEGLKKEDLYGKDMLDAFPGLNENSSTLYTALNENREVLDKYQTYMNKKGHKITTLNSTFPLTKDSEALGALEISKNYTSLKSLYDKISIMQKELLQDANKKRDKRYYDFSDLIGCNIDFLNEIDTAKNASKYTSTVLIYGETGTGKEVFAQSIHTYSERCNKPFIAQNCSALPEGLLEGILFGTQRGSFTGAVDRPGLFEQANGGTLLLDEINSMDISLQPKLLRVLQEGYVRRIGGLKDIPIDVRIIATTNINPAEAIEKGLLRRDLYYRLSVINIKLPLLKDRKEDIPLLIKHFINYYNEIMSKDIWYVSEEVEKAFISYSWPGNIRELKNYIEASMNVVQTGHIIKKEHFSAFVQSKVFKDDKVHIDNIDYEENMGLEKKVYLTEKKIIEDAMAKCNGNISKCAAMLNIKRQTLQYKLKKYGIIKK